MATSYEIFVWIAIFVIGLIVGRITMAIQYAMMKSEAARIKKK